jgi:hypothetical protein
MFRPRFALLSATVFVFSCGRTQLDPLPGFPSLMLWAWERPEDLRFLDPRAAGVAFLAGTITIDRGRTFLKPRLQPLRVAPGTKLMAVVRVESRGQAPANIALVADLLTSTVQPGVSGLQIDYDAAESERHFYRDLARAVRGKLTRDIPLTMTALVSWCASDDWIRDFPVAEAVPMYFRMGAEPYLRRVELRNPLCQASTGLSTDELVRVPLHHRVFLFNPRPWTRDALRLAMSEVNRWQ